MKNIAKNSLVIMIIVFIIGCVLIFYSPLIGQSFEEKAIDKSGGVMDTSQYEQIVDTNTSSYKTAGTIISLVGGSGLLLSGFVLYKEL